MNYLLIIIAFLAIYSGLHAFKRLYVQKKLFTIAQEKSKQTNKPLIVIGDPCNGFWNSIFKTYNHGDLCLDINGCNKCKKYDINKTYLNEITSNSIVLFESGTFGFSNDLLKTWSNAIKASGGDFYSCGTNNNLMFSLIGRHIYGYKYKDKLKYAFYPYQPGQVLNYYVY